MDAEYDIENRLKIRARQAPVSFGGDHIELYAFTKDKYHYAYADQLCMKSADENQAIENFCRIDNQQAQVLMDDLWQAGIRPSEGSGSAGAMAASQRHLADLRKILFHKMGIKETGSGK